MFYCLKVLISAIFEKRVTDLRTDGPTDKASYRDAWTHLKKHLWHSLNQENSFLFADMRWYQSTEFLGRGRNRSVVYIEWNENKLGKKTTFYFNLSGTLLRRRYTGSYVWGFKWLEGKLVQSFVISIAFIWLFWLLYHWVRLFKPFWKLILQVKIGEKTN